MRALPQVVNIVDIHAPHRHDRLFELPHGILYPGEDSEAYYIQLDNMRELPQIDELVVFHAPRRHNRLFKLSSHIQQSRKAFKPYDQ